jgi:hypothetical protein
MHKKRKITEIHLCNFKKTKPNQDKNKRKFKDIQLLNSKKKKNNNYCCIHEDKTICNIYECTGISNRNKLYIPMPYII